MEKEIAEEVPTREQLIDRCYEMLVHADTVGRHVAVMLQEPHALHNIRTVLEAFYKFAAINGQRVADV